MEEQKIKLGARILSEEELNAILPNAKSVYEQITVFRNSIPNGCSKQNGDKYEIEQKTNNIGIMGCRGAGKTSILKTFYHKLEAEKGETRDIILPIIVPENMSSGTTLMDAVLGRMKYIVDEKTEEEEKNKYSGDCIYSGRTSLEQQYNELVKQYCYIKKDYRDILIRQFTTEQNYVDKTKKVFGSDSEFINLFNQFVIRLLQDRTKTDDEKSAENSLIFLFIDDVDLSTNRCMDIARTLLVYLSNPRIVTFISGDIQTFEEELTLEFLRQEKALDKEVFLETYCDVNDTSKGYSLLERKKRLTYEYLKKIIPPAYRRTIRYWSLEERGNYRITGNNGSEQKSLVELLVEVTKEEIDDGYFVYKENNERRCMQLAFHMFDDTSRGLNNVYNVLQELYELKIKEGEMEDERKTFLFWRLIETMVDSKPLYAKYKSELLHKVIVLGQGRVKVDFKNAGQLLYRDNKMNGVKFFSAADRFAIYFLIDFSFRLFSKEQYNDQADHEAHYSLKNRIIQEYLSDETIEDKIASKRPLIDYLKEGQGDISFSDDSARSILIDFLKKCDFFVVLHLIRRLGRAEIYKILEKKKVKVEFSDKDIAYMIAYALIGVVRSVSGSEESIQNKFTDLFMQMKNTMLNLLNKLSLDPWTIYGMQFTEDVAIGPFGMRFWNREEIEDLSEAAFWNIENYMYESRVAGVQQKKNLLWAEYESQNADYWIYYEKSLREKQKRRIPFNIPAKAQEVVLAGLTKTIMNQIVGQKIIDQYEVRALNEVDHVGLLEGRSEKEIKEIQVIKQIDELGLWDNIYVHKKVFPHLWDEKGKIESKISQGRVILDATWLVEGAYSELVSCYKGSSGKAIIHGLESKIQCVMFLQKDEKRIENNRFSDGKYYLRLEQALIVQCLLEEFLEYHDRVLYGKKEVRKLLMEVKELPLVLHTPEWDVINEQLRTREQQFFYENPHLLRDYSVLKQESNIEWNEAIENVRKSWYDNPNGKSGRMEDLIIQYFKDISESDYRYFRNLVQKRQITRMCENGKADRKWKDIEPDFLQKDYIFIFHSYLRYLQANKIELKETGARAEDIAKLAQYILDSESKADEKMQTDIYQIISGEITITEEEFETLF